MSALNSSTRAFGSPSRYIQGRNELENIREYTELFGRNVFVLIDVVFYNSYQEKLKKLYSDSNSQIHVELFHGTINEDEISRATEIAQSMEADVVVGMGGGQTMDTAKAVADNCDAATIIIPTTASTDAPTISLSVIHSSGKATIRHYIRNPDLVLLDTDIIAKAPVRFLIAGMGDGLSTYIESRAHQLSYSPNHIWKGFQRTISAMAIAKACHDTILKKGLSAKLAAEKGLCTPDFEDVVEANTLMSGLGVQNTSSAGAHSIAEGLTILPGCSHLLHGEAVAFGIPVQLIVEGRPQEEIKEIYDFFNDVGLPTTFADLGIPNVTSEELQRVAETSLLAYWNIEPFHVTSQIVYDGLVMADQLGNLYKQS